MTTLSIKGIASGLNDSAIRSNTSTQRAFTASNSSASQSPDAVFNDTFTSQLSQSLFSDGDMALAAQANLDIARVLALLED